MTIVPANDETHREVRLEQPSPAALGVQYAVMMLYGITASIVGVTTITWVGGEFWGAIWPLLVATTAGAAFVAVVTSRYVKRHGFEIGATIALLAVFTGYTTAIIIRTLYDGDVQRLPVLWLPVALAVQPFVRLLVLSRTGANG